MDAIPQHQFTDQASRVCSTGPQQETLLHRQYQKLSTQDLSKASATLQKMGKAITWINKHTTKEGLQPASKDKGALI